MQLTRPRELNRVVITGMGGVTPQGNLEETWTGVLHGESVIKPVTFSIEVPTEVKRRGGRVIRRKTIREETYLTAPLPEGWDKGLTVRDRQRTDINGQLLVIAIDQALKAACLGEVDRTEIGLITGTNLVFTNYNVEQMQCYLYFQSTDPLMAAKVMVNNAGGYAAGRFGFGGTNFAVSSACASGGMAIGEAFRTVQYGDADIMFAAGTEGADHPSNPYAFSDARAYSQSLEKGAAASRPGSVSRDGFVMGNACVVLVLESLRSAKARGANILAEVVGYGNTDDRDSLYDPPDDGKGLERAIRRSVRDAEIHDLLPNIIGRIYYNGHETGTPKGDKAEIIAVKAALSEELAKRMAMSFTKSTTGHLLGCAGALEAALCVKAIQEQLIPPTINLDDPDEMLEGFNVIKDHPYSATVDYTISPSAGFGGHNACLVFKRWEG